MRNCFADSMILHIFTMMIEVYAYWHPLGNGRHARNGTLIVSGGCDTIVGNAILKNPGSSRPLIEEPDGRYDGRFPFRPDPTMYALVDLFELNKRPGTIRLFNLLDFVDTDPTTAKVSGQLTRDNVLETVSKGDVPTYLGWGGHWKEKRLAELCEELFDSVLPYSSYLSAKMDLNPFTHPLYLMRYGRKQQRCEDMIASFRLLMGNKTERQEI